MGRCMAVNLETLDYLLERNLQSTLRANFIDVETGQLCKELSFILTRFLRRIARQYQPEIDKLLREQALNHTEQDLVSWVVNEMKALQSITFSLFYHQICQDEGLNPGQHRINCATAHSHSYLLAQLFQEAVGEWRRSHEARPSSKRFVKKQSMRDWAPWLVDLIFGGDDDSGDDDNNGRRDRSSGGGRRKAA